MKIGIFSFAVNNKFPIDIQYRQFQKYCRDECEFIILNDAFEPEMEEKINLIAASVNAKCHRIPQSIHIIQNPSEGYAASLNWATQHFALENHYDIIVLMHTDVFPIDHVSILDILQDKMVASVMETRNYDGEIIEYFYPALTIIDINQAKTLHAVRGLDFSCALGLDTGGRTYKFVNLYTNRIRKLSHQQMPDVLNNIPVGLHEYFKDDMEICFKHELNRGWVANGFYHYIAGSQWNATNSQIIDGHAERMRLFLKYFY